MSKAKWKYNIIVILIVATLIGLAIPTMYALVKVQGVGMFWAMQKESLEYDKYNMWATMWGILAMLVCLAVPCILKRNRKLADCMWYWLMYFTFVPMISPAFFCHLFDGHNLFAVIIDKESVISTWADFQPMFFPMLVLVICIYICEGYKLGKWHITMLGIAFVTGVALSFLPELSPLLLFWMTCLMIIPTSDFLKKIFAGHQSGMERVMMWLCIVVLWGRGCYRMLEIVTAYLIWS